MGEPDAKMANDTNDTKAAGGAPDGAPPPMQYQFAQKPNVKQGWEGMKQFLWNSETAEFLGRTGCSWLKIGTFYLIYYTCLTGYFLLMLFIFYQTLDGKEPKWQTSNGIIGDNPGVGYRPMPPDDKVETTLIQFRKGDTNGNYQGWVDRLDTYLEAYKNASAEESLESISCDWNTPTPLGSNQVCEMDVDALMQGDCNKDNHYGFKTGKPCIALKLNRIFNWIPKNYENVTDLPDNMPKHLVEYIKSKESDPMLKRTTWISCEGENPADIENIGKVEYYPYPGFPDYFFPYKNQEKYLSPLVFAHFTNPTKGVLISIRCRAWAKNIHHGESMERVGSAHFELMFD